MEVATIRDLQEFRNQDVYYDFRNVPIINKHRLSIFTYWLRVNKIMSDLPNKFIEKLTEPIENKQ